jgi:hypothetical protein
MSTSITPQPTPPPTQYYSIPIPITSYDIDKMVNLLSRIAESLDVIANAYDPEYYDKKKVSV